MFRNWSIKKKLTLITMTTSSTALALSALGFLIFDVVQFRKAASKALMTEAQVIGTTSTAPLAFGDSKAALETLEALKVRPEIISAAIYNDAGELLASYPKGKS